VVVQALDLTVVEHELEVGKPWVSQLGLSQDAIRALKSETPTGTPAFLAKPPLQGW
jgi:hypothetical protein